MTTPRNPQGFDIAAEWAVKNRDGWIVKRFEGETAEADAKAYADHLTTAARAARGFQA